MVKTYFFNISMLLPVFLVVENFAIADQLVCPASIQVKEELNEPTPPTWAVRSDSSAHYLAGISFYDGEPANDISIAPTRDAPSSKSNRVASWNLQTNANQVWLSCRYLDTSITLSKPLPKPYKDCKVLYGPGGIVTSINCN